jgi:hypothetical protein
MIRTRSRLHAALARLRSGPVITLAIAVLVGSVLRVVGLTWGLPAMLHPDEWVIVDGALDMARRNSFEPMYYMRPDHVEIKLSYLAYAAVARGSFRASIEGAYAADPGLFLYLSRMITAIFGVAQIVLAYFIGRRIAPAVGAVAAVLFALLPALVEHAHFATPDVPLTTMLLAVTLACMHYLARPGLPSLLIASACVAVSIAIKYPGAIAGVIIALVVTWAAIREHRYWRILSHGLLAVATVILSLFLISPSLFTNVSGVVAAFTEEARTTHPGADGLSFFGNLAYYATGFVSTAGIVVTVLAFAGVYFAVRHRLEQTLPMLIGVLFWLTVSALPLHWARWGLPMYISPLLAAAVGAVYAYRLAGGIRGSAKWRTPVAAVIATVVIVNLGLSATVVSARLVAPDTRLTAARDLAAQGITPQNTAWEGYSPFQPGSGRNVFDDFDLSQGQLTPRNPDTRYLILSSCMNARYLADTKYEMEQTFYRTVSDQATLIEEYRYVRPRPGSQFEPASIASSIATLRDLSAGGMNGCDIDIYELRSNG